MIGLSQHLSTGRRTTQINTSNSLLTIRLPINKLSSGPCSQGHPDCPLVHMSSEERHVVTAFQREWIPFSFDPEASYTRQTETGQLCWENLIFRQFSSPLLLFGTSCLILKTLFHRNPGVMLYTEFLALTVASLVLDRQAEISLKGLKNIEELWTLIPTPWRNTLLKKTIRSLGKTPLS